jgi:putative nucleotidyltransferase with HDIG domain
MINRDEALVLLKKYLRDDKLIKHSLAVEAILLDIAKELGKDNKLWGVIGLLHDLDYEYTKREPEKHANLSTQILEGLLPESGLNAIKAHNYTHTNYIPTTSIDKALIAADAVSGLIIATALIIPSKKLSDVKIETLVNKYKDNSFARGCSRSRIAFCLDTGIEIDKFLILSLKALQGISDSLGL